MVRRMHGHSSRVSALAWNGNCISSGSRDTNILHHDTRLANSVIGKLETHCQEVCGLTWSSNGKQLASGGNDNVVCIWDAKQASSHWTPRYTFTQHTAAVKALAWCPWQSNLLVTGGGTADRYLRFWHCNTGQCVQAIDTKSQVCSVVWNPHDKELVTGHGYSHNQLTVWKYPSMARIAELKGHSQRVLHLALSPDGQTVCSGAADETLRFWKIFQPKSAQTSRGSAHSRNDGKGLPLQFVR